MLQNQWYFFFEWKMYFTGEHLQCECHVFAFQGVKIWIVRLHFLLDSKQRYKHIFFCSRYLHSYIPGRGTGTTILRLHSRWKLYFITLQSDCFCSKIYPYLHSRVGTRLMHINQINTIWYLCIHIQPKVGLTKFQHS